MTLIVAMTLPREPVAPAVIVDGSPFPDFVPVAWADMSHAEPKPEAAGPTREVIPSSEAPAPSRQTPAQRSAEVADRDAPMQRADSIATTATTTDASTDTAPAPAARTIPQLNDEARALLPYEDLYSATPPPREGDYYTPGNGSEDDVFYRPRALDPNPSRFARAWQPRGSLLDDWLGKIMEKATGTVSIPLNSKFNLVCGTVAGVAGGCTIVRNGGTGVIVQRPPPAPWDRSNRVQCRQLRQALDEAEEAAQVAYFIERLSALCNPDSDAGTTRPDGAAEDGEAARNDEARREAGLPEDQHAPEDAGGDA